MGAGVELLAVLEVVLAGSLAAVGAGLVADDGAEEGRRAHAAHYLALAEQAAPELGGSDQVTWLGRLEVEHDNLRAVLGWAVEDGETELGLKLARRLARFWHVRGHVSEGRAWFERLLAAAETVPPEVRAWPTYNAAFFAWAQTDLPGAKARFQESLELFRIVGDAKGEAAALGMLGAVAEHQGDYARAMTLDEASLALNRQQGNTAGVATLLDALGLMAVKQGDLTRAETMH